MRLILSIILFPIVLVYMAVMVIVNLVRLIFGKEIID